MRSYLAPHFFFFFKTVSFEFKSVIVQLVSVEEIK